MAGSITIIPNTNAKQNQTLKAISAYMHRSQTAVRVVSMPEVGWKSSLQRKRSSTSRELGEIRCDKIVKVHCNNTAKIDAMEHMQANTTIPNMELVTTDKKDQEKKLSNCLSFFSYLRPYILSPSAYNPTSTLPYVLLPNLSYLRSCF